MKPTNNYGLSDSLINSVKKAVEEAKLHPNQQKLDVHEPEKEELTSQDFKKLRSGKKVKDGIDTKPKLKEEEQIDEARSEPVDIAFETRRGKTENQQEVEHAARYEKSHGVKSKFADGPNGRTVVYSHSDPKKVKGALIKHHGGEDVSHIKIKEAYEQMDEAHRRGGNRFLNTREKDAIQKKMKPLDPNAPVEYKDKHSITRGLPHEEQLIRHIHAATGHHVYISPFTHDMHPHDSREVITKEVYNTGGKGTYGGPGGTKHTANSLVNAVKKFHNKKLRAEEYEQMDEIKLADLPRRMVKGKSYGADYVDPEGADETAADMKKPEPKRKSGPQGTMKRRFIKDKSKLRMQYK